MKKTARDLKDEPEFKRLVELLKQGKISKERLADYIQEEIKDEREYRTDA